MEQNNHRICLPDLGEVKEVRVIEWLKTIGDRVVEGDDLVEVETEKTTFIIPAPVTGCLKEIAAADGVTVLQGGLLGEMSHG